MTFLMASLKPMRLSKLKKIMVPLEHSSNTLAVKPNEIATGINEIAKEKRGGTTDTRLCLARFLKTTPDFWMNPSEKI